MECQNTTIHHNSTTDLPAKNHVQTPDFAKTPAKTHNHHAKNKRPDSFPIGPLSSDFPLAAEAVYWL
jgi:hypothetical protein